MNKIKSCKGITGIDIVMSLLIISATAAVLLALYLSTYISNVEIERKTKALEYASQIFEKISESYFSDVTTSACASVQNGSGYDEILGIEIEKGYTVNVTVNDENADVSANVVKNIQIVITYKVGNNVKTLSLSNYKLKENLKIPNSPELNSNMVAVKKEGNLYKTTTSSDEDWYDYLSGKFAYARLVNDVSNVSDSNLFVWIPTYAYYLDLNNVLNIKFVYLNKRKILDSYGNLVSLENEYTIDSVFANENQNGFWILVSDISSNTVANRLYSQIINL